jgi:hypothetical protein
VKEGEKWEMWYGSSTAWGKTMNAVRHVIKHAQSRDGIDWARDGRAVVGLEAVDEIALLRPTVVRSGGGYRMWYSCLRAAYRIGYAESADGLQWTRKDSDAGITVSDAGWDSESVEYPFVFEHRGETYMLYNGNGYGRTGFGIAILE